MKRIALLLVFLLLFADTAALAARGGRPSQVPVVEETVNEENVTQEETEREKQKRLERLLEEARQDTLDKLRRAYEPKAKDYDNNTVCSFGPQFREVSPRMTDDWYMFTPVDLSQDGTQIFDLIAGNMFVVGEVSVTTQNGRFQVDYHYNSAQFEIGREYFTLFLDYDSIKAENLENLHAQKRFSYGKSYSIADKLDGDTDVILFVCNTTTFQKTTSGVGKYYSTNPDRVAERERLLDMIGKEIVETDK